MIRAQQARRRRVRELLTLDGKDLMGREQAESIRISTDCPRQFHGRAWGLVQHVSDTEVRNHVQTAWQRIGPCQIQ
jgi:hypothetical protein